MKKDPNEPAQPTLWAELDEPRSAGARSRRASPQQPGAADANALWNIDKVAAYLGIPKQTVYGWRTSGYGPAGFRVGKHVRWRASTVIAWTLELENEK